MKSIFILIFVASSCSFVYGNTFGGNNKRELIVDVNKDINLQRIGKLKHPEGGYCTASLVGPNLIVTASHCLVTSYNLSLKGNFKFYLGLTNGSYLDVSDVEYSWFGTNYTVDKDNDWAILKLSKPLGEKYGYFKTRILNKRNSSIVSANIAGYSNINSDQDSMYLQRFCAVLLGRLSGISFAHQCDAGPGDSGAPLFVCEYDEYESDGSCDIVGLHVAAEQEGNGDALHLNEAGFLYRRNIGASAKNFHRKLQKLLDLRPIEGR